MKVIYFKKEEEMNYFCDQLYELKRSMKLRFFKHAYWGNKVVIEHPLLSLHELTYMYAQTFMTFRYYPLLKKIIRHSFYYRNEIDTERIIFWTDWVLFDSPFRKRLLGDASTVETYLTKLFHKQMIHATFIHFDSLVTFCLRSIMNMLQEAVGLGIDEMKREEEHQTFIHSLREWVKRKKPKMPLLHVVQDEPFQLFNKDGKRYHVEELKKLVTSSPLYVVGLDENELNLTPILTLLPKKLLIYGDTPLEPKTIVLQTIYEERSAFFKKDLFPFPL